MTIQAWTFLISRNQSIDYKTIVAPDFIAEAKIRSLLLKISDDDFTESEEIAIREVHGSEVGNFTVVFRSVKARSQDIGENENKILKDPFGRAIYWMEGLVFQKSRKELQHKIGESHLDQAHRELQEKYSEFWHEDKLSISHVIDLVEVSYKPDNKFSILEPLVITLRPQLSNTPRERTNAINLNKPLKRKVGWTKFVLITIVVLFLMGIFWKIIGKNPLENCIYSTGDVPIKFNNNNQNGSKNLEDLRKEYPKAEIFLSGSLWLDKSYPEIQNLADKNKQLAETTKQTTKQNDRITLPLSSTTLALSNNTLIMTYHPIDVAIPLLQNKTVTSGKLDARIIEPISPKASSCNALQIKESNH